MKKCRVGELRANGVKLEAHELETVMYFVQRGETVELIVPSNTPNNKNADLIMRGIVWEMKCPMGRSTKTVEHLYRKAARQSNNVIFDLRKFKADEWRAINLLLKLYSGSRSVRKLKIIKRDGLIGLS